MSKIKIALIGAGNIAQAHLEAYKHISDAEIYAICDINEDNLTKTAEKYNIERKFNNVDEMLTACPELDAADVCVWNINHAPCAIKALNAGLDVICEKPMAYSAKDAIDMKEAADKNGKLLMIGFVMRFMDEGIIAKDFVDKGYIGDIYYAKAQYVRRHGNPGGWFGDKSRSGGGPVIDLGVHVLDLTRYLMGNPKPVSVYATTFSKLGNRPNILNEVGWKAPDSTGDDVCTVEDFGSALIRFDNGAVTSLECSYDLNTGEDVGMKVLYGTKGGLDLSKGVKIYTECNNFLADIDVKTHRYKNHNDGFVSELTHFVDCVKNSTECRAKAEDGIAVMQILDAIYESARTGHEVIIK